MLFFFYFLLTITEAEYGLLEGFEAFGGEHWQGFSKELKLLLLLRRDVEGFGGFTHVPVDLG